MMIMTRVAKIPPKVDKALAVGPINFNPPNMINNGIKTSSEIVISHDEITGKFEKKSILVIKLRGSLGASRSLLNLGWPYSNITHDKQNLSAHSEIMPNLISAIGSVILLSMLMLNYK
jgi:hypothetical protein